MPSPPEKLRVVCAMSGGVDSSVAAWLLREQGYEVVGLFMRNGVHLAEDEPGKKSCCSVADARDARMVAAQLGIAFQAVDLASEFGGIVRTFLDEYAAGRTPNPCAICNRDLKLGRLLDFALDLGASHVATGHYARVETGADGRVVVRRGADRAKDQSYQLFAVAEANLARTLLPLGGLEKAQVRELAAAAGIRTALKPDSQEICFVPGNDYRRLLAECGVPLHAGALVDSGGRVLGRHAGTEHFTIGQRRGAGVAAGRPLYVLEIHPESGTVVLGDRAECASRALEAADVNWIGFDPPGGSFRAAVQVRYRHTAAPAMIEVQGQIARVLFDAPQHAVAPGQGAAFYEGERLLGGGWIAATEADSAAGPGG
ncbi:MAG: tRNA 2-thiouridine(34) synthase MnmA [Planctomycetota bacterium]